MPTFAPDTAASLPGDAWLQARRTAAAEAFVASPLPTEKDEVWRYSRIDRLDLERFVPAAITPVVAENQGASTSERIHSLADRLGPRSCLVVTINGVLATVAGEAASSKVTIGRLTDHPESSSLLGSVLATPTDFPLLNDAFAPDPVVIDVPQGVTLEAPIVIIHAVVGLGGSAVFPRTVVRAGAESGVGVIEVVVDADEGALVEQVLGGLAPAVPSERLVVPVTELDLGEAAVVDYVSVQALGAAAWQLAHQTSRLAAGATLSSYAVALGGIYARLRTDSALMGESASSRLRAAFIGRDDQMLDFRTLQDHCAPRTTSDLLFMGAVADTAHSVYSGLIRMQKGAVRSDARQTNHNLVLAEGAQADSVPNLDIEENDVQCSHGSTVGPVDEDQRYYLESRGIEPGRAEQLIVAGFFEAIAEQVPLAGVRPLIGAALAERSGVTRD